MKITKNSFFRRDIFIIIAGIIIAAIILFNSANQPKRNYLSNFCKPSGISHGTDTIKVDVSQTSSYVVWVHLESPMQINFNDLPDIYNPLLVAVDGTNCYQLGGSETIQLNTWTWVDYLNTTPPDVFRINLSEGQHTFAVTGSYASIDRIELLNNGCQPISNGSNCIPKSRDSAYLPQH